jgi:hypothetical protein
MSDELDKRVSRIAFSNKAEDYREWRGKTLALSDSKGYGFVFQTRQTMPTFTNVSEAQPLEEGNSNRTSANRKKTSKNKYRKYFTAVHRENIGRREVCAFSLKIIPSEVYGRQPVPVCIRRSDGGSDDRQRDLVFQPQSDTR